MRKYYVRVLVEEKLIKVMPCGTKEITADGLDEKLAVSHIQKAQKYNTQCHITTRDTRRDIIACPCLLDMGTEEASGRGAATTYIYICVRRRRRTGVCD